MLYIFAHMELEQGVADLKRRPALIYRVMQTFQLHSCAESNFISEIKR